MIWLLLGHMCMYFLIIFNHSNFPNTSRNNSHSAVFLYLVSAYYIILVLFMIIDCCIIIALYLSVCRRSLLLMLIFVFSNSLIAKRPHCVNHARRKSIPWKRSRLKADHSTGRASGAPNVNAFCGECRFVTRYT